MTSYFSLPLKLTSAAVAGFTLAASPALALEVTVNPTNPRLGDTISTVIQLEDSASPPTVTLNGQSYAAFQIGGNRYRALLPTTPLDRPGSRSVQVEGDGQTRNLNLQLRDRDFAVQRIRVAGGGDNATEMELARVAAFKALVTPEKFWSGPFLKPTSGSVSTEFGVRRYYNGVFAQDYYHRGVDYAASTGTPVIAPAGGRVALVGRESEGFRLHGNVVGIDHGQGVVSIFLHLSRINVKEGDVVRAGQQIGAVGSTGAATGPHLHWGLYVNGSAIDPVPWRYTGIE
ncbi:M23 family metallopeptidase [Oscillatoria sp. FACHB-1406]|uniref:M23 family metallopeptidase n=1 Tax=Oscillatoria sp. FACHB-1406 TaxID=2692846 RepID=UPI0016875BB3|nr:M23 family metallopeptidase [Oscillatoria sp. FACHB-1406]MBD2577516.1 M23 family metallopeptidase [Oscillatoria sp. FACHB-1406]